MHYRIIDLLIFMPLPVMILVAWRMNLFRCAMLMARSFFAFLFSMWLFGPLGRLTAGVADVPLPYLHAAWFAVIGAAAWFLLPAAVLKFVRSFPREMRFSHPRTGRIVTGLFSGWFLMSALTAFLLMIPEVEALYFRNETYPILQRDRRRAAMRSSVLYSSFTFTTPDALLPAQMEAAAEWIFQRIGAVESMPALELEELPRIFGLRYRSVWATDAQEERLAYLQNRMVEMLAETAPERVEHAPADPVELEHPEPDESSDEPGPDDPGLPAPDPDGEEADISEPEPD